MFCASLAAVLAAAPPFSPGGANGYSSELTPGSYATLDLFDAGVKTSLEGGFPATIRLLSLDLRWWRLRAGISLGEFGYGTRTTFLTIPARAGFTLWQRPRNYVGSLYGMLPEIYLQGSGSLTIWTVDAPPTALFVGHAELRAAADLYGLGVDVGAGVGFQRTQEARHSLPGPILWHVGPVFDARVHVAIANFGIWED